MLSTLMLLTALFPPQDGAGEAAGAARSFREAHEAEILAEFCEFLALPNSARDPVAIRANADWIVAAFARRGVELELLEVPYAPPAVFGEIPATGADRTVVLYAHYDGQPVQPEYWTSTEPFSPALFDGPVEEGGKRIPWPEAGGEPPGPEARIYARSAGDDKAPIVAMLAALDALRAAGLSPAVNVKFFFEGEEEMGSAHLGRILEKYRERLGADLWLFCDGPVHQNRMQQVVFGVRGITGFDLTVYGARRQLHSGHYGNWAPNPAMMLVRLLASMKDADGRVLVEGFYDDVTPLGEAEERALAAAPDFDRELMEELWLARTEGGGTRLDRLLTRPSLNVRGLRSAGVGRLGRNVVPEAATASIDIRLVAGMDPERTVDLVVEHVRRQGFHVVEEEPGADVRRAHERVALVQRRKGYPAFRTPMDGPMARRAVAAVRRARGEVVLLPTLGGSLPLSVFDRVLGVPVVIVPIANHDDNQHAPDENLRLQNLRDGIETLAALLRL